MTDARTIDLRSDTVSLPTQAMYERMRSAPLGDDGLDGDPTTRELEATVARLLSKEAALYLPSATMGNLAAVMAQAGRQESVLLEASSHMYMAERGAATLSGTFFEPIPGHAGSMDTALLEQRLVDSRNKMRIALVCLETSHNNAGGTVPSLEHMRRVMTLAHAAGARVHLDGARLFNAAVALDCSPAAIGACADTVTVCLSKGLSAPMGGVLAGSRTTIGQARSIRKMLGGTQRQTGLAAAAGLVALDAMVSRLAEDHARAASLAEGLGAIPGLGVNQPQTNIVQVDVAGTGATAREWEERLRTRAVLVRPWGPSLLRCVTHRHIDDAAVAGAVAAFASLRQR